MGLTTRTLPSVNNGISRQPAILRSPDQTENEINTWGRIASGVDRRPPTETVAALTGAALDTAHVHHINRDVTERYVVILDSGVIKVFDHATGDEKTVNAPGGLGYLSAPGSAYRTMTVADYTFVVNSQVTCALDDVGADIVPQPAYYRWVAGTEPERVRVVSGDTDYAPLAGSEYQYEPNPTPAGGGVAGEVQTFEKLPDTAAEGAVYRVIGNADTGFVSYYVRRSGAVWDETVAPGLANSIKAETMPHALVREADGTFTFAPFSWKPRRMGDNQTNPTPVFVGRTLRDLVFYQNRLGFLVDESVIFSAAGDYGDFWRRTVLDYIESDVVSVAAATTDVAILDFAVPFNDGLVLFSRQRQFSLTNGEAGLSASSVAIRPVLGYLTSPGVRPVPLGNQVYFASDTNGYTAVQEYTRLDGRDATDAAEVTAHVPALVPKGVSEIIPAADMDAIFLLTRDAASAADRSKVFAYQFFWDGQRKLQSAWRVWDFVDGYPISGAYFDGQLHLVVKRGSGFFLERIRLTPGSASPGQDHLIYLDRQVSITGTYSSGTNTTTFTLPYAPDPSRVRAIRGNTAAIPESLITPAGYVFSGNTLKVPGNESVHPVTLGHTFTTYLEFSRQYPVDFQMRPLSTGRLQIHNFTVVYTDSAYFRAEVSPYGRDAVLADSSPKFTMDFTGRIIGSSSLVVGQPAYHTGSFTFAVAGNAENSIIALSNDSPYGSTFVSAEFEGLYFNRAL